MHLARAHARRVNRSHRRDACTVCVRSRASTLLRGIRFCVPVRVCQKVESLLVKHTGEHASAGGPCVPCDDAWQHEAADARPQTTTATAQIGHIMRPAATHCGCGGKCENDDE